MDQRPEIQLQGKMDHTVKIIIQAGPVDGIGGGQDRASGAMELQSQKHHRDAREVIGVIIPHSMEADSHLDGSIEAGQPQTIQIVTKTLEFDTLFEVALTERFGYVYSLDRAEKVRRNYEVQTNTSYVAVNNVRLNFGQTELSHENHRIYWEEPQQDRSAKCATKIQFDGVPFILLSKRVLDCQHGRDWHKCNKEKAKEKTERKRRKKPRIQETRKLGCLANITMRELLCFPEFKIDDNSEYKRKFASKKLRAALKDGEVKGQKRIYIDLPEAMSHNHPIDQNAQITHQTLDERVLKKLQEIVRGGVLGVEEVRLHLQNYVKNEIFFGQPSLPLRSRRFFPSKSSIRTHIRRCCAQQKHAEKEPSKQLEVQQEQAMYIGQNFCSQYYNLFDTNRSQLESMYHKELSIMTFENVRLVGSAAIMAKLVALPFTTVKHCITSIDCHCTIDNTLLIAVLGQLQTDADPKNSFHQTFILKQFSDTLYIVNDIFRLSLHNF